jgi:hypothetical protein
MIRSTGTERLRVHRAPGIPRALVGEGETIEANLAQNMRREREGVFEISSV